MKIVTNLDDGRPRGLIAFVIERDYSTELESLPHSLRPDIDESLRNRFPPRSRSLMRDPRNPR